MNKKEMIANAIYPLFWLESGLPLGIIVPPPSPLPIGHRSLRTLFRTKATQITHGQRRFAAKLADCMTGMTAPALEQYLTKTGVPICFDTFLLRTFGSKYQMIANKLTTKSTRVIYDLATNRDRKLNTALVYLLFT